ncbi:putative photosystem I [Medicago truncatula]|uniref:Putative photosystem I n=1 Tax=Medicago truncatula TaxID=3880 RepID=I3SWC2_MEDTR|nr:protein CURVATURE THYLAKOID 1B, chloroplastic [Medicago truncatula]AFK44564.1 unknown [Medicago truncatula]KEH18562.1 thylakoid membrane phosphoprotein 14 kDa protein [Medicago truncatula]RHN39627.1 putative photosystem I [Medicago truncatula]
MALISSSLTISFSSNHFDCKASFQSSTSSPQCVSLSSLPSLPLLSQNHALKTTHHRKIARDVMVMATGDAPTEVDSTELPEFVKNLQEAWDKYDDRYAVSSLVVASVFALWSLTGLISAIDRLPLIPGVLELIGIGYTGWFAYKNVVFKPEREELIQKVKETITAIIGSN